MSGRMLRPRLLTVGHGSVWLCDERLPIVVRVDQSAGEVLGVLTWPIDDRLRDRPSIVDIDAGGDAVWVAAPNARGVVRLSSTLDHAPEVVTTAAAVGTVPSCGSTCWARQESHGGEPDGSVGPNIWRITSEAVEPVDFGGFVWKLEASRTGAVALVQRPSRSHVEQPNPGRGRAWFYPGVVAVHDGAIREVVALEDLGGAGLFVVDDRIWVRSGGHAEPPWLAEVDVEHGVLGDRRPLSSPALGVAVDERNIWVRTNEWRHRATWDRQEALVSVPIGDGADADDHRAVVRGEIVDFVGNGEHVWATREAGPNGERPPVRAHSDTLEVVDWPVTVDLSEHRPVARPPDAVDPFAHAQEQRALLTRSRVEGLTFDRVLVDGQFPDAQLILLFRSQRRRGVVFGRRWPMFDDFGIPQTIDYATIELEEDVVAAGHGLPPVDKCVPDSQGVVWF